MKVPRCRLILVVVALSLALSSAARSEFSFTPGIGIREEYNDNVNLSATDKKEDFITTINPNITMSYRGEHLDFYLDYGLRYLLYARNTEDDKLYHNVNLQSTMRPFRDYFFIKVSDFFCRVPIDQRRPVGYENNVANLTNSNVFSVNPYLEYPLSATFKVKGGYTYQNSWYESTDGDNSQDHTVSIGVSKEVSSRLATSLFYDYLFHRPEIAFDEYDRQGATLGLTYGLSDRVLFDGTVGWVTFDYRQPGRSGFDALLWSANVRYLLSQALTLRAGWVRSSNDTSSQTPVSEGSFIPSSQEIISPGGGYIVIDGQQIPTSAVLLDSIEGGLYRNDTVTAGMTYSGKITVSITGFRSTDRYMDINREDRSTGMNVTARIPFSPRLTVQMNGHYSYNKYLPEDEKVNRYLARLVFDYVLKITTVTVGYAFNKEDSSIDLSDYTNNVVWIGAHFKF